MSKPEQMIQKRVTRQKRVADCSTKTDPGHEKNIVVKKMEKQFQKDIVKGVLSKGIKNQVEKSKVMKQNLDEMFKTKTYQDCQNKIVRLAKKSGLRQVNALSVAKDLRKLLKFCKSFTFEQFRDAVTPQIEKLNKSALSQQIYSVTLMEIFKIFDTDQSGTVDAHELANCMAIMCGGSMTDKINASFLLFDLDNSGTMSFDELLSLIKTVFGLSRNLI